MKENPVKEELKINFTKKKLVMCLYNAICLSVVIFCICVYSQSAFAFESHKATTVDSLKKTDESMPLLRFNAYYNTDNDKISDDVINLKTDRKEVEIPNLLDEITLRRIKESNVTAATEPNVANDIIMDSKVLEYFEDRNEIEAVGNVVVKSKEGTVINADKAIYSKNANVIKLFDNVVLRKQGNVVNGDYMLIDLNTENALINEPTAVVGNFIKIKALEGYAYADQFEAVNGSVDLAKKIELRLQSSGFASFDATIDKDRLVDFNLKKQRLSPYKIKTKEILIEPGKDHDRIIFKDADIFYKKFKLATVSSIELFSDKEMSYIEANIPIDIGSQSDFGMYAGLGYIFKVPAGGLLKLSPALVLEDGDLGIGLLGGFISKRNRLQAAWATNSSNLIIDGKYKVNDKIAINYARHSYQDDWFVGGKRAGYMGELEYRDRYMIKDLKALYEHRITAGYATEYHKEHQEDDNWGTMKLSWQTQMSKPLFAMENKEQEMSLDAGIFGQSMVSVYGSGDVFGLIRGGPYINSRVKNWSSRISYALGGIHGASPFYFDEYTYGKSSLSVDESIKLNKYVSVGYRGVISPLKDNYEKDLLTENRFYAVAGPEDIKLAFSYDTVRKNTYLDFMFLLGTDTTGITYNKLIVASPDKLQKKPKRFDDAQYYKIKVPEAL